MTRIMTMYEEAVDAMAQIVLGHFGLCVPDSYVNGIIIDVDDDDLVYFIDLVEDGRITVSTIASANVGTLLDNYHKKSHLPTYYPVIEAYIEENWEDALDQELAEAVRSAVHQGSIDNGDALFGGELEAEKSFVFAVCARLCRSIRENTTVIQHNQEK